MEIFNYSVISLECDGCKKAFPLEVPVGAKLFDILDRISDFHREQSPQCPRDVAQLHDPRIRSFLDEFNPKKRTLHFRMGWRDGDELDLTRQERKTPTLIIDPYQHRPLR